MDTKDDEVISRRIYTTHVHSILPLSHQLLLQRQENMAAADNSQASQIILSSRSTPLGSTLHRMVDIC